MHLGDDYIGIKAWLVKHYGDASRIVNDTIAALSKKKNPNPNNNKDRYTFYSDIGVSLLRLERLMFYLMNAFIPGVLNTFLSHCYLKPIILSSKGN